MRKNNYSSTSVLFYFLKIAFKCRPTYFLTIFFRIILQTISPFSTIIFPTLIINELTKVPLNQIDISKIILILSIFLVIEFIIPFLLNLNWLFMLHNENMVNKEMKKMIGTKMMKMRFYHLENPKVLDQISKAQDGLEGYGNNLGGFQALITNFTNMISQLISLIGIIYIIAQINIWLIFMLLTIVGIRLYNRSILKKLDIKAWEERKRINRENDYYTSLITDFKFGKDIRLNHCKDLFINKNINYIEDTYRYQNKLNKKIKKITFFEHILNALTQLLTYGYVAYYFIKKIITIAQYSLYVNAINRFVSSSYGIFNNFLNIRQNTKMMVEFKKFMDLDASYESGNKLIELTEPFIIEFKDVSFAYPNSKEYVLKNINYRLNSSKKMSLVGENGAGKTTFIKLLMRLYEPSEGIITLNGINIKDFDIDEYYQLFSVVFQDYQLIGFTLGETITSNDKYDNKKVNEVLKEVNFQTKLDNMDKGLSTSMLKYFDDKGIELSGGESQKVAIARALFKNGKILILDEPTAALDPLAEYEIYHQFNKMTANKMTIYISHRLSSCRFCDEILVLEDGVISQVGSHNQLISDDKGKYYQMFKAQAKYYQDYRVKDILKGTEFQ